MIRHHFTFDCAGARLVATLDPAPGSTGLLLVTGGNEVRAGAWSGQAALAAQVAAAGFPVMRFDRRGCGDSEGVNAGYRASGPEIAAALDAFRARCPHVKRVVGMGNCDAASALMLAGGAGCDALLLSNPWIFEGDTGDRLRGHYTARMKDAAALKRLLSGRVALRPLLQSLFTAARGTRPPEGATSELAQGLAHFAGPVRFLVAERDRTAQAFLSAWGPGDTRIMRCAGASHAYVEPEARAWLLDQVLEALRATA